MHQDAFDDVDCYTQLEKQLKMLKLIIDCHKLCLDALSKDVELDDLIALKCREAISKAKYIPFEELEKFDEIERDMRGEISAKIGEGD